MAERLRLRPRGRLRLGGAAEAPREEQPVERKPTVFAPKPSFGKPSGLRLPVERPRLRLVPKPPEEKPAPKPEEKPAPLSELEQERLEAQRQYLKKLEAYRKDNPEATKMLYRLNGLHHDYLDELKTLNARLAPMNPKCKFSVVIAAAKEERNIERTLYHWTVQQKGVKPEDYEIIVFVNKSGPEAQWDKTAQVAKQFKLRHPQYNIHVVKKEFNFPKEAVQVGPEKTRVPPGLRIGLVFKVASDLAILRNMARNEGKEADKANYIIQPTGSDAIARSPDLIHWILQKSRQEPKADFFGLQGVYSPKVVQVVPLLWALGEYRGALSKAFRGLTPTTRIATHGPHRAGLYAKISGFKPHIDLAEEVDFGERAMKAGAKLTKREEPGMVGNPRRSIQSLLKGNPVVYEYNKFTDRFEDLDKAAKQLPESARLTPANLSREITAHYNVLFRRLAPKDRDRGTAALREGLRKLGLKEEHYSIVKEGNRVHVIVRDITPLEQKVAQKIKEIPTLPEWLRKAELW